MIDGNHASGLVIGILPLIGVIIGSILTWLIQRNEWGRQRRWELRRDAVLDALRGYADLEDALTQLNTAFVSIKGSLTDEAQTALEKKRLDAMLQFQKCCSAYKHAQAIVDLAVGADLAKELSKYFQLAAPLAKRILSTRQSFLGSAQNKQLAERGNMVIVSARKALGIKNAGDLPLPSD